jgi:hypothetical protein
MAARQGADGSGVRRRGVLVLEAVTWHPRLVSWHLSEDVAHALGVFQPRRETKRVLMYCFARPVA